MPIAPDAMRKPAAAGRFYPDDPPVLKRQIQVFTESIEAVPVEGEILALVAPHAGYAFSGATAAAAFKHITGRRFDTVFVLSPSHFDRFDGVSLYTGAGYQTPLGIVPIDRMTVQALIDHAPDLFLATELGHREEHGIEVELPFLQTLLAPGWQLVPLVMADQSIEVARRTAAAILHISTGKSTLIIASSDLYHGYNYEEARASVQATLVEIEKGDPIAFIQGINAGTCQACGSGPIAVVMHMAHHSGVCETDILAHTTSADVTGDRSGYVVGYGAAIMYKKTAEPVAPLNEEERRQLLSMARSSIEEAVGASVTAGTPPDDLSDRLKAVRGIFVTLKHDGDLRGCIGQIQTETPLYEAVHHAARAAATRDPRFQPIKAEELKGLTISVSILSPFVRISDRRDIQVGRDGLYIRRGEASGLLLPVVARERGWDAETFLTHTCMKAGLNPSDWQAPDTEIYTFTTEECGDA